ncbi:uncharacterized protein LOC130901934 [Diorhabda carinulata]|uniref:uncharacterized protein LOC130901934 n=1 Tax=Diorhabda carinulata TaxID=1163345 RepID=UPI0025A2AF7C|nr:uncharacterized protein LOC130901934 [Diorhabda carinulata]
MVARTVYFSIVLFSILLQKRCVEGYILSQQNLNDNLFEHGKLPIEDRSMFDQMNAMVRLPGDLNRRDFIAMVMDAIIVLQFLPLPWAILLILHTTYKVCKFFHPAYWFLFPRSKPTNIKGLGFSRL